MSASFRSWIVACALLMAACPVTAQAPSPPSSPPSGEILLLDIKGGIGPAMRDYLRSGLRRASDEGARAVVLRIDTPGGLDAATRDINQAILASPVPVIAWVAPEGARAASAGTYILYACHLAAMAPATSLGAATPVSMGGPGPGTGPEPEPEESRGQREPPAANAPATTPSPRNEPRDAMSRKAVNDAVGYLRSLAELRGRNQEFAEAAVRDAATLTATQALSQGVIEIIAGNTGQLLRQAQGRKVRLAQREVTLDLAGKTVTVVTPDWRARLLAVLTEPTVAYLLLLIGLYGLVFEGYSPGAILPGMVGAICLLLAAYGLQVLPVNYAGVALIVVGVALIAIEFAMPSVGAAGVGGVVALVAGSLILFDTQVPGFGVPGGLIAGIGAATAVMFMGMIWLASRARRQPVVTGQEELVGQMAVATRDFDGLGQVHVRGEHWQARSAVPVRRGQPVRVLALDGLVLRVEPEAETRRAD
ncbi:nodulation protein NfeD [Lysobacter sp. S4-A87]|uniref:NfeD family protein n=1 Tax=Lysobacter sp. S4-A87 TaxID=2925843 RepID=UPI001F536B3C|nr:nodulation protein NfeD [Lysobacter sp. S4-A87]UNK50121.1 nodulation protein NfeD [Lysobacter sp. S4-A87]